MRRLAITAGLLAVLTTAAPARAITGGSIDIVEHPMVGALLSPTQFPDGTWSYCTGTLVEPDVVVTAAHCEEASNRVRVTFDPTYTLGDPAYAGTFYKDPAYSQAQNDPHDIAVVVLDQQITTIQPATLPSADTLASLPSSQRFTAVGYGAHDAAPAPGGRRYVYDDVRRFAYGSLTSVNGSWLRIGMNGARGDGGTCYGDSGGPNFVGSSFTVGGLTITGDTVCRATTVAYRLDTPSARGFLAQHVALP